MLANLGFGEKALQVTSRFRQYIQHIGILSRNAKLYVVATSLQGFASGIWGVIFFLYLKLDEVGFQANFISNLFTAGTLATGLVALPAGLVIERLGTKRAIIIGLMANLVNIVQIIVLQPSLLLFASLVSGLIGTVSWVASAPFMMENSTAEERTYLFSVSWAIMIVMSVVGSYVGGVMPNLFNAHLGLATGEHASAVGYRIALLISTALALSATIPILLIREKVGQKRQRMGELLALRNIKSPGTIIKLMIPVGIIGFGAGFIVPLFNLFFSLKFKAAIEEIGILNALGNATLVVGTLLAPELSRRLSKVKAIALCEFFSMPFIMLVTVSPNLAFAGSAYVMRNALMNMAGPISGAFQMEMVTEKERATTNGLLVMADNIPRAITASISGAMMTLSDFYTPFLATTITYLAASSLFFLFFRKAERLKRLSSSP
jgi:MFS family permease